MFKYLLFLCVATTILALSHQQKLALANSLEVGRPGDPNVWDCADCYADNKPINSVKVQSDVHDIVSIISTYPDFSVLAFRYTATLLNVWQDLLWTFQVKDEHTCDKCKVQREYNKMWEAIKGHVIQAVKDTQSKKLIITGISLGGGLACISYVDIRVLNHFDEIQIITFGAPRVGNKQWAAWFDATTPSQRIFLHEDPIAILPRCLFPHCNYRQTGTPIVCTPNTESCTVRAGDQDEYTLKDSAKYMIEKGLTYDFNNQEEVGGIIDGIFSHIFGYKTIYNYTVHGWGK